LKESNRKLKYYLKLSSKKVPKSISRKKKKFKWKIFKMRVLINKKISKLKVLNIKWEVVLAGFLTLIYQAFKKESSILISLTMKSKVGNL